MSNQNNENKREKFVINVDEPIEFETIAKTAYYSSADFCKMVSELFSSVFADYEGCLFDASTNGVASVSLIFNHGNYDDGATVATEKMGGKTSGSSIIDRSRIRDRQMSEGDRYYLTDDGKDAITPLLNPVAYNNGNPNWRHIVSEFQDNSNGSYYNYGRGTQFTKVSNISLSKLCGLIFGKKNKNGDDLEYDVKLAAPMVNQYQPNGITGNYMLTITSISAEVVESLYRKMGWVSAGANIIRA